MACQGQYIQVTGCCHWSTTRGNNERVFVAARGNNTVEVIDLKAARRTQLISGLSEPQGLLYLPAADRLYVANGGDGVVRIFDAASWRLLTVNCGDDADNVRYEPAQDRIYVGYGGRALGVIDSRPRNARRFRSSAMP